MHSRWARAVGYFSAPTEISKSLNGWAKPQDLASCFWMALVPPVIGRRRHRRSEKCFFPSQQKPNYIMSGMMTGGVQACLGACSGSWRTALVAVT